MSISKNEMAKKTEELMLMYRSLNWKLVSAQVRIMSSLQCYTSSVDFFLKLANQPELLKSSGNETQELAISSIHTAKMVNMVTGALKIISQEPNCGKLYYYLLYYSYCTLPIRSTAQIMRKLDEKGCCCSESVFYRSRKKALIALGNILWCYEKAAMTDICKLWLEYSEQLQDLEVKTKENKNCENCK